MANRKNVKRKGKPRRRRRARNRLWVGAALLSLVFAVAGTLVATRNSSSSTPLADSGTPTATVVSPASIDRGEVWVGKTVSAEYRIRNDGTSTLRLGTPTIKVVKGCCPTDPKLDSDAVTPGGETTVRATMSMHGGMNMSGPHHFVISVPTNDPSRPMLQFDFLADWLE